MTKIGRKSGYDMNDFDTNSLISRMFMSATLDVAVLLGQIFGECKFYKKPATTNDKTSVRCDKEVDHRSNRISRCIEDWLTHTSLAKDYFVNWQSSPIVISKSVCILRFSIVSGQMNPYPESIDPWKKKIVSGLWVPLNIENWIESTGNRWNSSGNISQDSLHYRFSPRFRKMMNEMQCEPTGCMIFVSMYNDIVWEKKKETKNCVLRIPKPWEEMQEDSRTDIGRFLGLDQKRNGTELTRFNRMVNGIMSLKTWWSTSVKAHIPCSVDPVLSNEDICEAKDVEIYTSVVIQTQN